MKTVFVALALVIAVAVLFPDQVESVCCPRPCKHMCNDCSRPTPYCGYKSCNIIGCGCPVVVGRGACRTGIGCNNCRNSFMAFIHDLFFGKEDLKEIEVDHEAESRNYLEELFATYDQSGNGALSLQEFRKLLSVVNKAVKDVNVEAEFRKLDTDNNGKLTKRELDP